ncbi:MAG: 30S ribosome-binding factor RbfA [Bacteroidetes bacterium]|jgi:ribosome-binding factor A|nr:30S ribosome-binding factor RbfA [Bacteroidota bacterium]
MESTRQQKIGRLLQKELGDIFQHLGKDVFKGKIISVTVVRVSADLSIARVYLSIFPVKDNENYMKEIDLQNKQIRFELGKRVRHQLRKIPELSFFHDDSVDYAMRIEELLKQDKKKK